MADLVETASSETVPLLEAETVEATQVYPTVHQIKNDVMHFIDTPLSFEALTTPEMVYTLINPLHEKYSAIQRRGNMSASTSLPLATVHQADARFKVVFCFLLNRVHFQRDENITTATLSRSRAELCEILAIRALRDYGNSMLDLTVALTTSWPIWSGADARVLTAAREERDGFDDRVGNAIEMAIIGRAKRFIKSSSCQKVVEGIWSGKCVYQAESSHSILADTYKRTPIHFYDPHKAPLLDHYRLKVPSIRAVLEYCNFLVLFVLFVVAIEMNEIDRINTPEIIFMVYALGFTLEKVAAMQEHGIKVYFKGTWNGFDLAFVTIYCTYAFLRLYGISHGDRWARETGIDCLAIIACLMFPRLAFVTLKNNLMVLSLRAMMAQFMVLMMIAAFCFGGFLYALWTLSRNQAGYSSGTIAWWMLDLWFGLDASGFDKATQFHPYFGPVLMVTYACLSNTLLLTVLVSILSHTFSEVNSDAAAEAMFRKAVSTIEGVKADSLFSYQPPVNLIALCIMLPASYILTPRWFHKVNVFMIRLTSFPTLLAIAWYERQAKFHSTIGFMDTLAATAERVIETLPRQFTRLSLFEGLAGADADIDAVFDIEDEIDSSALDTQEHLNLHPPVTPRAAGGYRRSFDEPRPHFSPQQTTSPPPTGNGAHPAPRHRVQSILNRGMEAAHSFTSPLATIFQPLIVDDDINTIPEDDVLETQSSGPLNWPRQRRSSTMQRRNGTDPAAGGIMAGRRIPGAAGIGPDSRTVSGEATLSKSPDDIESLEETVEKRREAAAVVSQLSQRMEGIEARQQRIEELLVKISDKLEAN